MPFTPTHAAAVLPFLRTPLPASTLVIGSMAPDIPFYLPFDPGLRTHTAAAVGTTDVLFGALAWLVWHGLLAAPALWAAPRALHARLTAVPLGVRVRLRDVRAVLLTLVALAVGSATHVLWDEFTHAGRWGPEVFPALGELWGPLPGYRWLQHTSGLVGGLLLLAWLVRWWRRSPVRAMPEHRAPWWPWVLLLAVAGGCGRYRSARRPRPRCGRLRRRDLGWWRGPGRRTAVRDGVAPASSEHGLTGRPAQRRATWLTVDGEPGCPVISQADHQCAQIISAQSMATVVSLMPTSAEMTRSPRPTGARVRSFH